MTDKISRRELLKTSVVAGASSVVLRKLDGARAAEASPHDACADGATLEHGTAPRGATPAALSGVADGEIVALTCNDGVYVPPRGQSFFKFGFDFPEPSVAFQGLLFSFRLHTFEDCYGLDRASMTVEKTADGFEMRCSNLVWAGDQMKAPGSVVARARKSGDYFEWKVSAETDRPIKSLTSIVRGVPRGQVSVSCNKFFDPKDNEILKEHPYLFGGMTTPLVVIQKDSGEFFYLSARDEQVRATRFYLQPGDEGYRAELIYEREGWEKSNKIESPAWRVGKAPSMDAASRMHFDHVERAFQIPDWEKRTDVPEWFREIALVLSIHGMHWTGYIYNDYAKIGRTLQWAATQIPAKRVLVFLPAWDGRYYWNYPLYEADPRLGGEEGFRALIEKGQRLGFRMMPMFGANVANRNHSMYAKVANAQTVRIDGDDFANDWVDMDNDRSNDGWGAFMNLAVPSWREYLAGRISEVVEQYHVDAYFLDIAGAWVNNLSGGMYEGTVELVKELRAKYPGVLAVGEMHYDALMSCIPVYQVPRSPAYPAALTKYARSFEHLSRPAPGRGSTGVHEDGFAKFKPTMPEEKHTIPTITVVDDTFEKYRDVMTEVIVAARVRAGIA
jgi:hypothetical protein